MKIGIGIDTGGTYTDAVIYDFTAGSILGTSKALTTKEDLTIGILQALDGLPTEPLRAAQVISLSTTLATNACVEDMGGNAKLIFLGGDPRVIDKNGCAYGLPLSSEMYIQESHTKFSGAIERDMDWELFNHHVENDFTGLDGVGIIEINAMRNSAVVEKKAKEQFQARHDIPVICSHELFNELNCLQRGASALLNARLVPVIREFLRAIKQAMAERNINASVAIVRSDGGLMSEEFAHIRPVETLLCGPAASVLGSAFLANEPDSIVVDMGGTTTDIAMIRGGKPVAVTDGVRIGKWKTFVNGLYISTFGLGGDTAIHYRGADIFLEDYRIVPVCVAAEQYPQIVDKLRELLCETKSHSFFLHEFYLLVKDIADNPRYTQDEQALCSALANGPLSVKDAAAVLPGQDIYNFNMSRLLKDGVVQMVGLTPTDIMHLRGDFCRYNLEAASLAAEFVALNIGTTVDELCDLVYDHVRRKLYVNIVKVMLENNDDNYMKNGISADVLRVINDAYDDAKRESASGIISLGFRTNFTLTGVGAPIRFFLHDVAKMLGTTAVTPQHCEVANALGAIVCKVYATITVEIRPESNSVNITGFTVYGSNTTRAFATLEEAEEFAAQEAEATAREEAKRRGARGKITVSCQYNKREAMARDGIVYLGTQVIASAVGDGW